MMETESENDIRSCYCAAAVSFMLRKVLKSENYGFDREKLAEYVV